MHAYIIYAGTQDHTPLYYHMTYFKLTDHLKKAQHLATKGEMQPSMREVFEKNRVS
jgi:hypothetical protein